MSRLEHVAQRVLAPLVLGEAGRIHPDDQGAIAMWAQKTALTAMLMSSNEQRERGYGLPQAMYTALYERRDRVEPLDASQFWIGRYEGTTRSAVRVTPMAVRVSRIPEPDRPHAYALTLVLGQLILHGLTFDTLAPAVEVANVSRMPQLWPKGAPVLWPRGQTVTEESFLRFADGKTLRSTLDVVDVQPWTPAAQVPRSVVVNGMVRVPALCEMHSIHYPISLLEDALQGIFYAFVTSCDCPVAYLMHTGSDSVNCKAAGASEGISATYADIPGDEMLIRHPAGAFFCKRLTA
ncbi:hypothetical protein [Nocardioides seonyuensis]|nr:hypothetical protein [Nocardioides seonyuensis]